MSEVYERLREATADALFGIDKAGLPAYTLAEQDTLGQIASTAGITGDPLAGYLSAVRSTLYLDKEGVSPLRWHAQAARRHAQVPLETPPSLPLLVVLTMAAEQMQAGTDMASNNYYGRLFPLLKVPEARQQKLITDYRSTAESIWGSLNAWLEAWEGERGVPTAYAIGGMRLIGLPMSQAVVRRHDRNGLHHVFEVEGLPPGFRMGGPDMELALDPYATRTPSPLSNNLRRLWTLPAARERIVQAACLELEAWTGGGAQDEFGPRVARSTRLLAYVRTFPRTAVEFNLALPAVSAVTHATFVGPDGPIEVPTTSASPGTVRLASTDALSAESLLGDVLEGTLGEEQRPIERRPRRIVPLRWDELQGCFVETERVALGEDNVVLAMADTRARLERHLTQCARPGWEVLEGVAGVPNGWILVRQVQVVGAPDGQPHVELLPLVPRARTSLTLRGGFVLPGRLRKWSSLAPPEVVALASGASRVTVKVFEGSRLAPEDELVSESSESELTIVSVESHDLDDGEYTVAMYVDSEKRPSSTATLRLRSADSPLFNVDEVDLQLVYAPDSAPTWPLSAGPADWPSFVNGARVVAPKGGAEAQTEILEFRPRKKRASSAARRQVRIGTALPADSCMSTGRHRFQLPTADGGKAVSRTIDGECSTCGLVKRFAATPRAAKKKASTAATGAVHVVDMPPVAPHEETDQQIAFDALSHVGHGSYSVFERIASQIEGSGLFADTFLRRQEVTGHIDVRRDDYMQAVEWAVNAATLVPVPGDKWVLIGARSKRLVRSLQKLLASVGTVAQSTDAGILRVVIEAQPRAVLALKSDLAAIAVELLDASPATQVASALPSLGTVEAGLRRIAVPAFRALEIWDTESASWTPATSLSTTGAFRLRDFRSLYGVRSRADLESGTIAIAGAQLVKHIASRWADDPLVGYHSRSGSVVVPLGADLPGLYGRALSLCSGRAPREIPDSRMVQYPEVPRNVADLIVDRLMN